MLRFWTWLRDFAARGVERAYMAKHYHARLCPNCRTWTHQVGGARDARDDEWFQYMQCNKCEEWSRWDMRYAIPVLAQPWRCETIPITTAPPARTSQQYP